MAIITGTTVGGYTGSFLLANKDKAVNHPDTVFDKVINLNLHRRNGESIVIRSDYEIVSDGKSGCSIQKCCYKPQIRVSTKAVTSSVGIEIDIYITNFYIDNEQGENSLADFYSTSEKKGNPFESVDIVFGYFGMFSSNPPTNLAKSEEEANQISKESGIKVDFGNSFYAVDMQHLPTGASGLSLSDIFTITTDKGAPDSVTHIHGFVTNINKGFYASYPTGIIQEDQIESKEYFTLTNDDLGVGNLAERLFFWLIQKRFVRNSYEWNREENKSKYMDAKKERNPEGEVSGFLNKDGADKFGCRIHIPEDSSINNFKVTNYKDENGKVIENSNEYDKILVGAANSVYGTLALINRTFFDNKMRFAPLVNGDWVVWSKDDARDKDGNYSDAASSHLLDTLNEIARKYNVASLKDGDAGGIVIPAVYSASASAGLCTIECPYFAIINPFQKVQFNSRYNVTDLPNFFARSTSNVVSFFVINWTLDFSTTGKENRMVIQSIGLEGYKG